MNKKKLVVVLAALVAVLTIAIGGTLAYFSDAEQKTNTMTIGNISINLEEVQYNKETGKWEDYEDGAMVLYPVDNTTGASQFNKAVRTYNDSPSGADAYIRTIVALPANLYNYVGLGFNTADCANGRHGVVSENERYKGVMEIAGEEYGIWVCTDKNGEAIKKDEYMLSLVSVWLYSHVTQEDIKELGLLKEDGTANFEVKVLTQGIQEHDLTHDEAMAALGTVNSENLTKWFAEVAEADINDIV
ncbi:MAG: hypothetical protein E7337_04900 [Clostridiales bacterium]|nr:hypothetical protein [Clostridiales bacterium]